jgi:hypothetical protein
VNLQNLQLKKLATYKKQPMKHETVTKYSICYIARFQGCCNIHETSGVMKSSLVVLFLERDQSLQLLARVQRRLVELFSCVLVSCGCSVTGESLYQGLVIVCLGKGLPPGLYIDVLLLLQCNGWAILMRMVDSILIERSPCKKSAISFSCELLKALRRLLLPLGYGNSSPFLR